VSVDEDCDSVCPIARSLSVVGDQWTLLIMREISLGVRRFDDIQALTGISPFLLTTRLRRLEKEGVIEKRLYNRRPPRYEYHATEKGRALDEVLLILRAWSMKWQTKSADEQAAVKLVHKRTKKVIDADWRPPPNRPPFRFADAEGTIGPAFAAERAAKRRKFQASRRRSE
jgi:DNA-binding HxlR family transcriptional regulator